MDKSSALERERARKRDAKVTMGYTLTIIDQRGDRTQVEGFFNNPYEAQKYAFARFVGFKSIKVARLRFGGKPIEAPKGSQ